MSYKVHPTNPKHIGIDKRMNNKKYQGMRDSIHRYFLYVFFDRLIKKIASRSKSSSAKIYFNHILSPIRNDFDKTYGTVLCNQALSSEMLKYGEIYKAIEAQLLNIMGLFKDTTSKLRYYYNPDYQKYVLFYMECCHYLISDTFKAVENYVDGDVKSVVSRILKILEEEIDAYNETAEDKISEIKPYLLSYLSVEIAYKIRERLVDIYKKN